MQPHDADSPNPAPPPPPEPPAPVSEFAGVAADRRPPARTWLVASAAALLAGVAAWLVGEATLDYYKPSKEAAEQLRNFVALNREQSIANGRNGAIAFGALGGLLGLGLGVAGGLSRRSTGAALAGGFVGLTLGAVVGALPAFAIMPWQWYHRHDDPYNADLVKPLMYHFGLWGGTGAVAGLAYGIGRSGLRLVPLVKTTLGGLIGAVVGTLVYELIGAMALPMSDTADPIPPTALGRVLARLCLVVFSALGVVLAIELQRRRGAKRTGAEHPLTA